MNFLSTHGSGGRPPRNVILIVPIRALLSRSCSYVRILSRGAEGFARRLSSRLRRGVPIFLIVDKYRRVDKCSSLTRGVRRGGGGKCPMF